MEQSFTIATAQGMSDEMHDAPHRSVRWTRAAETPTNGRRTSLRRSSRSGTVAA